MRVGVVVVVYHPTEQVVDNLKAIEGHHSLAIVDNSPMPNPAIREVAEIGGGAYIFPACNLGISAALNSGIQLLRRNDSTLDALICFDQDSRIQVGFIETMARNYELLLAAGHKVAWLGPRHIDTESGVPLDRHDEAVSAIEKPTLFTSGLFLPTDVLDITGSFDPSFFVDHADSDICLRARSFGFCNFQILEAHLDHRLGSTTFHRFGRRMVRTTNHPPSRLTPMTANRLRLWKRYWKTERRWILFTDAPAMVQDAAKLAMFEKQRLAKIVAISSGFTKRARLRESCRSQAFSV